MKTNPSITLFKRAAVALTLAILLQPLQTRAAKLPTSSGIELSISGPIFSVPDYTARPGSDQCRNSSLSGKAFSQRKTTLDLTALGHPSFLGLFRRVLSLEFPTKGTTTTLNFWVEQNCLLTTQGRIVSGKWPLSSDGSIVVVEVPAGALWSFTSYGGAPPECVGNATLSSSVLIVARRNDARTDAACDCPSAYTDVDGNMVADECEQP